jgi:hypothetical protein
MSKFSYGSLFSLLQIYATYFGPVACVNVYKLALQVMSHKVTVNAATSFFYILKSKWILEDGQLDRNTGPIYRVRQKELPVLGS